MHWRLQEVDFVVWCQSSDWLLVASALLKPWLDQQILINQPADQPSVNFSGFFKSWSVSFSEKPLLKFFFHCCFCPKFFKNPKLFSSIDLIWSSPVKKSLKDKREGDLKFQESVAKDLKKFGQAISNFWKRSLSWFALPPSTDSEKMTFRMSRIFLCFLLLSSIFGDSPNSSFNSR